MCKVGQRMTAKVEEDTETDQLLSTFSENFLCLLENLSEVFPECENTLTKVEAYRNLVKSNKQRERMAIKAWKEASEDIDITNPSPEQILDATDKVEVLKDLGLRKKWADPDFSSDSQKALIEYAVTLTRFSRLYAAIPPKILTRIESVASTLKEKIHSNDMSSLDLPKIGNDIVAGMSNEDMEEFSKSIEGVCENLAGSLGLDMGKLGMLIEKLQGGAGDGGAVDIKNLIESMGSLGSSGTSDQALNPEMLMGMQKMLAGLQAGSPGEGGGMPDLEAMMNSMRALGDGQPGPGQPAAAGPAVEVRPKVGKPKKKNKKK